MLLGGAGGAGNLACSRLSRRLDPLESGSTYIRAGVDPWRIISNLA
jgi:hypothetical protein